MEIVIHQVQQQTYVHNGQLMPLGITTAATAALVPVATQNSVLTSVRTTIVRLFGPVWLLIVLLLRLHPLLRVDTVGVIISFPSFFALGFSKYQSCII